MHVNTKENLMKNTIVIITILALAACGNNTSNNKKEIVAVKADGEYYALDDAAKKALSDKDSNDRVICQSIQRTGSHLKDRKCSTKAQLKAERERSREMIRRNSEATNKALTSSHKGN